MGATLALKFPCCLSTRYASGIKRSISINVKQEILYGIRRHIIYILFLQLLKQQKTGNSRVSDKAWTEFMPQQNFKNKNNQNVCIYTLFPSMKQDRDCSFIYIIWGRGKKSNPTAVLYRNPTAVLHQSKH